MLKKIIFVLIFSLLTLVFSYGDVRYLWATTRPTIEGVNTRVIPMNSVKSEFLRSWDEYAFIIFSDRNIHERDTYSRLLEMVAHEPGYRQFSYWLSHNRNFVTAYTSSEVRGNITIAFVIGNYVYEVSFNISVGSSTINNIALRREWESFIDDLLQGL